MIERKRIISELKSNLQKDSNIYAFWLEGADSLGTVDKYSDLDVWLDVKDGQELKAMKQVEKILSRLGSLDLIQGYNHPDPKITQTYFHIKDTSEYLLIDVCIQSHSRKFSFVKEMTHELPLVLFDKKGVTKTVPLDKTKFNKEIKSRVKELVGVIKQQSRVTKYIKRNQFLESLVYYHKWILQPLVELLRIKYAPVTHDYYLVHVSQHLPKQIVKTLEDLYKVQRVSEISDKMRRAVKLFNRTLADL